MDLFVSVKIIYLNKYMCIAGCMDYVYVFLVFLCFGMFQTKIV